MRELRKDVESTLESPKEELVDNMDEMKIEEVLMGLKGLKQEEVFSFLGKYNFTPAETEVTYKKHFIFNLSVSNLITTSNSTELHCDHVKISLSICTLD